MDPTVTLLLAFKNCDDVGRLSHSDTSISREAMELARADAADHFRNLADWLDKGGFVPDVEKAAADFQEYLS